MLGENIKTLRKQKGYSQETLAEELNVVRQTISKWEKGYSVPDAEMLERMAELFEVPVAVLLGSDTPEKEKGTEDVGEIVQQLAILNEQLAKQSRNRKRVWKIVFGVLMGWILLTILFFVMAIFFRASNSAIGKITTTHMHCTLDGETYIYGITYDEQYRILEAGGDAWIADHVEAEDCSDANTLIARIENLMTEWGGTCKRIDEPLVGTGVNAQDIQHHVEDSVLERYVESSSLEHHEEYDEPYCQEVPTIEHHQETSTHNHH
ncbi:MAG: helix-turn-helix transcriptional regulator [Lachnospiraceae bacterium]|nr:helix-turn-helix transcriptional regulator [Lachnospiraceae bacterium]